VVSAYAAWHQVVKWHQYVRNDDVQRLTKQSKLTAVIQLCQLTLFGHAQHCTTESETTPPYAPRRSRFGSEPPSVEDDVDIWRYAILELHARNDDSDVIYRPARYGLWEL